MSLETVAEERTAVDVTCSSARSQGYGSDALEPKSPAQPFGSASAPLTGRRFCGGGGGLTLMALRRENVPIRCAAAAAAVRLVPTPSEGSLAIWRPLPPSRLSIAAALISCARTWIVAEVFVASRCCRIPTWPEQLPPDRPRPRASGRWSNLAILEPARASFTEMSPACSCMGWRRLLLVFWGLSRTLTEPGGPCRGIRAVPRCASAAGAGGGGAAVRGLAVGILNTRFVPATEASRCSMRYARAISAPRCMRTRPRSVSEGACALTAGAAPPNRPLIRRGRRTKIPTATPPCSYASFFLLPL